MHSQPKVPPGTASPPLPTGGAARGPGPSGAVGAPRAAPLRGRAHLAAPFPSCMGAAEGRERAAPSPRASPVPSRARGTPRVLTAADTALSSALSSSPKPSQRHMLPRTALLRRSLGGGAPAAQRGVGAPRGRSHMHASPLRAGRGACNASGPCDWPRRNRWAAAAPSSPRAGGRGPWESATARSLYAGRDSYSSSSRRGWVRGGGGGAGGGAALPRPAPLRPPGRARSAAGCGAERVRRGRGRGLRRPVTAEGPLPAPGATRGLCSALLRRGGRAEPESPEPSPPAGKEPTWTFHRFPARVFLFVSK